MINDDTLFQNGETFAVWSKIAGELAAARSPLSWHRLMQLAKVKNTEFERHAARAERKIRIHGPLNGNDISPFFLFFCG